MDSEEPEGGARSFPSTHWSQIYLASNRQREEGARALGELVQTYRRPLLVYLQAECACTLHQAEEWLDAFIERRILEKELLRKADKAKGKFRGFLKTSLDRFVSDARRKAQSGQRRPAGGLVDFDGVSDHELPHTGNHHPSPGDREWAVAVIDQAAERTETFYRAKRKDMKWEVFQHGVYLPQRHGTARPSNAALALRFGFPSDDEVESAIGNVKRLFGTCLRQVVQKYVPSDADIDEEIRDLMAILSEQ